MIPRDAIDRMFPVDAVELGRSIERMRAARDAGHPCGLTVEQCRAVLNALFHYEAHMHEQETTNAAR